MDTLTIYWWSDEWCLTNYGYVQTAYLELDLEAGNAQNVTLRLRGSGRTADEGVNLRLIIR